MRFLFGPAGPLVPDVRNRPEALIRVGSVTVSVSLSQASQWPVCLAPAKLADRIGSKPGKLTRYRQIREMKRLNGTHAPNLRDGFPVQ